MSKNMKWQFDPNLDYQTNAVNSVLELFAGQEHMRDNPRNIYQNELSISKGRLKENMIKVQKNPVNSVGYFDEDLKENKFTIEMETGTGKTYVYLKTILELYTKYGFSKFIIVVPSIPIRMGIENSIKQLRDHFMKLYDGIELYYCYFVYDSKNTGKLDNFYQTGGLKIAIMNSQSFDKVTNIVNKGKEDGKVYWDKLSGTKPIVIIDEPQKILGTSKKKSKALENLERLEPLATLMYSATHRDYFNLLYRLDSYDAFKKRLVKRIRVSTIYGNVDKNYPYFRYIKFNNDLSATVELLKNTEFGVRLKKVKITSPCDLYEITKLDQYKGYNILSAPHKNEGIRTNFYTEILNTPYSFQTGENNYNIYDDDLAKIQMRITIKKHLDKQYELLKNGNDIKVLSLFFIDEVAKYRNYDMQNTLGEYAKTFEEVYKEVLNSDIRYLELLKLMPVLSNASRVHEGYFAIDKNKKVITDEKVYDSESSKNMEDIQRGIEKILSGKEKLIKTDEPISFIFAHSALAEGWDNPNVFNLCMLKKSMSPERKKQEIGRGLRLPRNTNCEVVRDDDINELTVVVNENYEEFAEGLQSAFNEDNNYNKDAITLNDVKQAQIIIENKTGKTLSDNFAKKLHEELLLAGFIREKDNVINKDKIKDISEYNFKDVELNENRDRIVDSIIEVMTNKESKKIEIVDDNKVINNEFYKYIHDADFSKLMSELEEKLNKKTVYEIKYDEQELINNIIINVNENININKHEIDIRSGVLNNADKNRGIVIEEKKGEANVETIDERIPITKSYIDVIRMVMNKTNFTKQVILKIISNMKTPELLQRQENVDKLIKIIEMQKKNQYHKNRESIKYNLIEGTYNFETDKMFFINKIMETKIGKSVFATDETKRKALCKYLVTDSDGEYEFAKDLEQDPDVIMFSKLKKGSFIIKNPLNEDYSPDWAVIYKSSNNQAKIYFIIETKWQKEWEDLTDVEKTKIICAKKHFEATNTELLYSWVNSWKRFKDFINSKVN